MRYLFVQVKQMIDSYHIQQMPSMPEQYIQHVSPNTSGMASHHISPKATPTPAIIRKGKNMMPRQAPKSSHSESISQEKANMPAKMVIRVMPMMMIRSLTQKSSSISTDQSRKSRNLKGALTTLAQHSPRQSSMHPQSQHSMLSLPQLTAGATPGWCSIRLPFSSWSPQWAGFQSAPHTQQNWQPHRQVMWLHPWFFSITNLHRLHCLKCRLCSKNSTSFESQSPSWKVSRHFEQYSDSQVSQTITWSGVSLMTPSHSSLGHSLELGSLAVSKNLWAFLKFFWMSIGSPLKRLPLVSTGALHSSSGQRTSQKFLTLQMTQWCRHDSQKWLWSQVHSLSVFSDSLISSAHIPHSTIFLKSLNLLLNMLPSFDLPTTCSCSTDLLEALRFIEATASMDLSFENLREDCIPLEIRFLLAMLMASPASD